MRRTASRYSPYGAALRRRAPALHLAIQLEASPEECLARSADGALSLQDLEALAPLMAAVPAKLASSGTEVVPRAWGRAFGAVGPVRDTVLCAPPQRAWAAALAPPSEAAVERLAKDAWAAAQPGVVAYRADASPSSSPSLSRRSSLDDFTSMDDYHTLAPVSLMDLDAIGGPALTPASSPHSKGRAHGRSPESVMGLGAPPAATEVFRAIDEAEASADLAAMSVN